MGDVSSSNFSRAVLGPGWLVNNKMLKKSGFKNFNFLNQPFNLVINFNLKAVHITFTLRANPENAAAVVGACEKINKQILFVYNFDLLAYLRRR